MKRKFLLLVCLLGVLNGVKAWTSVTPEVGKWYYLLNTTYNQFWYASSTSLGSNRYYGVTNNIAAATPIYIENGDHSLYFYLGNTKYYMNEKSGNTYLWGEGDCHFSFTGDPTGAYCLRHDDGGRYLNAEGSNSTCNFPTGNNTNKQWKFIAAAEVCASAAETNYVSGWTRVTSVDMLKTNPEDYFFAIFSANAAGLIVDATTSNTPNPNEPHYKTATDPLSSSQYLFEMDICGDGLALKSTAIDKYFANNSTYPWDYDATKTSVDADCEISVTLADGAYTINTKHGSPNNYLGLWTPGNGYKNGERLAGNKSDAEKGSFLIYRIAKKNLDLTDRMSTDRNDWDGDTGTYADVAPERYNGNDTPIPAGDALTQTISNLPKGVYEVEFFAWENFAPWNPSADISYGDNIAQVIGNDAAYDINVLYAINDRGWNAENTYTLYCSVTDGTLKYGVYNIAAGGNWAVCRPISLTFLTSSLPASLTGVSGKMNATVAAAQTTAIERYNAVDGQTPSNYAAAQEAIAAAETSVAAYANAKTYFDAVEPVLETTNFYTSIAYANNYSTLKAAYDAGTLSDVDAAALSYGSRRDGNMPAILLSPWAGETLYINTWSTESDGSGDAADFANPFYEYWVGSGSLEATSFVGTISGLTANANYIVTANVRVQGDGKVKNSIRMQVGDDGTPVDVTQGNKIGETDRYIKSYTAVGATDVSGNLKLTFTVDASSNISWLAFRDVNYELGASADQKTALATAITNAESKILGFESGEYAPYNNITVLEALAAAKVLDVDLATAEEVVAATNAIADEKWTANVGDVECVYNGDFSNGQGSAAANIQNYGWTRTNGWGQFRSDSDKSSTSNGTSYYNQPGSLQYGNAGYYTMPLKANTIYQLTFKYASWENDSNKGVTASVLQSSDGMAAKTYEANATQHEESDAFVTKTILFVTGAAGNYVLTLANSGNTVMTDVSITKASQTLTLPSATQYAAGTYPSVTLDRTFANTSNWYTLCAPFDFPKSAFAEVKVLDRVTDNAGDVNMTFTDAGSTISAGTPCLVKPASADATLSVEDVAIDPDASADSPSKQDGTTTVTYVGTFEGETIDGSNVDNAWVVSNNALYHVAATHTATVGAYRAYFTVSASEGVKALSYDFGGADAIDDVRSKMEDGRNEIYNLAGQKMSKLQRGVNIVNGKKVLVK